MSKESFGKAVIVSLLVTTLTGCGQREAPSQKATQTQIIGAPNGQVYTIEVPYGASREDIVSQLLQEHPEISARRRYDSATRIGEFTFYSDGASATRIGDSTFYSDGSSSIQVGGTTFYSDGSSSTQIGETTFHSDGSTSTQIGDSTFHSDGTICQNVDNMTFCN